MIGTLYIVSTPIGNLDDITLRAVKILNSVDIIVCEDTRVSSKLLNHLGINKKLISYNNYNENQKTDNIVSLIEQGNNVALISDAGTPLISDPGYILVKTLQQKNIKIEAIGGLCSVIVALTLSGLPINKFMFLGFLDKSSLKKKALFEKYKQLDATLVFFESPNRIQETLQDMMNIYEETQEVVIARELTKIYQEVKKDTLINLVSYFKENKPRGEFIVLYKPISKTYNINDLNNLIFNYLKNNKKESTKEMAKNLADITKINKTIIYDEIIKYKNKL